MWGNARVTLQQDPAENNPAEKSVLPEKKVMPETLNLMM